MIVNEDHYDILVTIYFYLYWIRDFCFYTVGIFSTLYFAGDVFSALLIVAI